MAAVVAALASASWRFLGFTGFNNDHYVHVARAYQILLGEWPVRDFVDPGMPLMYLVSAAARAIAGPALFTEWLIVAGAFAIGAACTVVAAARLSGYVAVALLAAALEIAINTRSFGYPKVLLYAVAAVLILSVARRPVAYNIAALAAITAAAFLFRHDHGLFIGLPALATVVMASYAEGLRVAVGRSVAFGACIILLLVPWALFVQVHSGLVEYFASGMTFWRSETSAMTLQTLPTVQWSPIDSKGNAVAWLFFLFHLLPFVCLAIAARRYTQRREGWAGESVAVTALALMAIAVNTSFMRESLDARIPDAVVPAALLGAWLLGLALSVRLRGPRVAAILASIVLVMITGGAVVRAADVPDQLDRTQLLDGIDAVGRRAGDLWGRLQQRIPQGDHIPSRYAAALLPFIGYLGRCTSPDDRLMVTSLAPEVYVLADRGFAGGHIAVLSGFYTSDTEQAHMISRLEHQSVPFVLLIEEAYLEMPRLKAYIEARYRPMTHIPVPQTKGVEVLVDRQRQSHAVDPSTGWPCFQWPANRARAVASSVHRRG